MKLATLLQGWVDPSVSIPDLDVGGLCLDSRALRPGEVFLALGGTREHGLDHRAEAIARGAVAVLYDSNERGATDDAAIDHGGAVPLLPITDLRRRASALAGRFWYEPSDRLQIIGITGTNGKTSCSQFLAQCLEDCAVIGTLGWGYPPTLRATQHTTPDAVQLQAMLATLRDEGARHVAMEVSSHGLAQDRVAGIRFTGAVFTRISRDHLDYHGTMEHYVAAKLKLLTVSGLRFVVALRDDTYFPTIAEVCAVNGLELWDYGLASPARGERGLIAENLSHRQEGLVFDLCWRLERRQVAVPLWGDFNVENVLAVCAVMLALGYGLEAVVERLAALQPVPGRLQRIGRQNQCVKVWIDYAHTPDALEKILLALRPHCPGALWVVFGCGGNRDRGKRPLMGEVASRHADHIVLTDDNPRHEASAAILDDILLGIADRRNVTVISDRAMAIAHAIAEAGPEDWILVAGKGHETYQERAGARLPFSDAAVIECCLAEKLNDVATSV